MENTPSICYEELPQIGYYSNSSIIFRKINIMKLEKSEKIFLTRADSNSNGLTVVGRIILLGHHLLWLWFTNYVLLVSWPIRTIKFRRWDYRGFGNMRLGTGPSVRRWTSTCTPEVTCDRWPCWVPVSGRLLVDELARIYGLVSAHARCEVWPQLVNNSLIHNHIKIYTLHWHWLYLFIYIIYSHIFK